MPSPETTFSQSARDYLLKEIPVNFRTVFFCLCASGAFSFPVFFCLRALGYRGFALGNEFGGLVMLLAFIETICLPVAAILFEKIDRTLAALGVILFLAGFVFFALAFPAVG